MSSKKPIEGRCGAKTRDGGYCERYPKRGKKRCRKHGADAGRPPITGYRSKVARQLVDKIDEFREGDAASLEEEVALLRALLWQWLAQRLPDDDDGEVELDDELIGSARTLVSEISKVASRYARIINQTAVTQAELRFLENRLVDIITDYVPEDRRAECVAAISSLGRPAGTSGAARLAQTNGARRP